MFEKGREKTGGRAKGTPNKTTTEMKAVLQAIIENRVDEELENDLDNMDRYKKWTILNSLAKYVLPTYNKSEETIEHTGEIKVNIRFNDTPNFNDNSDYDKPSLSHKNDDDEDWTKNL